MSSNDKIIEQLRKKLEKYQDSKEVLQIRSVDIELQLASVCKLVTETEEAIAALEGRTTETRRILEEALKTKTVLQLPASTTEQPKQEPATPPAEPGYEWVNGNLVPIMPTASETMQPVIPLPPVDEDEKFEPLNPMDFNPKY